MKNILFALIILSFFSCKKDKKSNQAIDAPTLNEMITNFSVPTEGHIDIETYEQVNLDGNPPSSGYNSFSVIVTDKIISNTRVKKGKIIIDSKEITQDTVYNQQYAYYLPDNAERDPFIKGLFGNRIIDFKLYETDNTTLVTQFNFKTPERLLMKTTKYEVTKSTWEKEKITWNADPTNKIGLVLEYRSGLDPSNHNVVFLADDGEESIKNVIGDLTGDIELTMYRGVIIVKTGTDNKKYKITCIAKSFTNVYLKK